MKKILFVSLAIAILSVLLVAAPTAPVAAAPEHPISAIVAAIASPPLDGGCAGQFNIHPAKYATIEVHVDETPAGTAIDGNGNMITGDFLPGTDQTKGTVPRGMWANFYRWNGYTAKLIGYAQVISCNLLGGDLQVFEDDIWGQQGWKVFKYKTLSVWTTKGWRDLRFLVED